MREILTILALFFVTRLDFLNEQGEKHTFSGLLVILSLGLLIFLCMCIADRLYVPKKNNRIDYNAPKSDLISRWDEEDAEVEALKKEQQKKEYGLDPVDD